MPRSSIDIDHIVRAVARARVETEPYTYLVCDDVFHPEDYRNILRFFPKEDRFTNVAPNVHRLDLISDPASHGKGTWDIGAKLNPRADGDSYWFNFRGLFADRALIDAFANALQLSKVEGMTCSARLSIDSKDAGLGPHTDRIDKLMSGIFYLADDSDSRFARQAGTQVLIPRNPQQAFTQEHYRYSDFDVHEYVEYKPNRLFAFAVANGEAGRYSFHGYHQAADFGRKTIKCHIHNPAHVEDGVKENERYKSSALDWIKELKSQRPQGEQDAR